MKKITIALILGAAAILANCAFRSADSSFNTNSQSFTSNTSNTNSANVKTEYQIQQERETARTNWLSEKTTQLTKLPKTSKITKQPYIKKLAVAFYKAEYDDSFSKDDSFLPSDAMAYTDEEAQTVILVKEKSEYYGDYKVTGRRELVPAFIIYKEVIIVDRSIPAIIYRKTFAGKAPARNVTVSEYDYVINGESPDEKVIEFIKNLPRQ